MAVFDQNGVRHTRSVRRERDGWSVTVWFGGGLPGSIATTIRRYTYRTRAQARAGDISHSYGTHGRIN